MVIGIWECGYTALPCPLLSVFSLMRGCFMASVAFTSVWLWKSTGHCVNTSQFPTLPFPNTHEMCRSCCNRICGCRGDSTLSNRTHFPFHRRNWVCLLSIFLTVPLLVFLFVEKIALLPYVLHLVLDIFVPVYFEPLDC